MKDIKIRFLSDKDFDNLPISETDGSDITDAIGFANTRKNKIFIRDVKLGRSKESKFVKDILNEYLVTHEIEHLLEDKATDFDPERPHIRFKKFRQVAGNIAEPAGAIATLATGNPLFATAGSALKGGIGGEKKSFGGAIQRGGTAFALSSLGSNLTNKFGVPQTGTVQGVRGGLTNAAGQFVPGPGTSIPVSGPGTGLNPLQLFKGAASRGFGLPSAVNKITSGIGNVFSNFNPFGSKTANAATTNAPINAPAVNPATTGGIAPTAGTPTNPAAGKNILSRFANSTGLNDPNKLLGVGSLAAGLLTPFPKAPEVPSSIEELRSQLQSGGSALSKQAQSALSNLMNQDFNPLSEEEIQASLRTLDDEQENAEKQVRDVFRSVRPGSDETSDSALRDALNDVRERFANLKQDAVATRTRDLKANFDAQRLAQIQSSLGASQNEMNQLISLAQLDLQTIMTQLQLDFEQASLFKQTFLNLGSSLISGPEQGLFAGANFNIGGNP